jgi:hypothetical protein
MIQDDDTVSAFSGFCREHGFDRATIEYLSYSLYVSTQNYPSGILVILCLYINLANQKQQT